jgi:hypothetical protein
MIRAHWGMKRRGLYWRHHTDANACGRMHMCTYTHVCMCVCHAWQLYHEALEEDPECGVAFWESKKETYGRHFYQVWIGRLVR